MATVGIGPMLLSYPRLRGERRTRRSTPETTASYPRLRGQRLSHLHFLATGFIRSLAHVRAPRLSSPPLWWAHRKPTGPTVADQSLLARMVDRQHLPLTRAGCAHPQLCVPGVVDLESK